MSFGTCFHGKTVLVTGAGRGIGRALVGALDGLGAKVYALSRTEQTLQSLKQEFPKVIPVCVDLSNWDESRKAVEILERMDCLINNAGVAQISDFLKMSPDHFDKHMNVNVKSVINMSQLVAQKMIAEGKPGSIINVSSIAGKRGFATAAAYCSSKAALEMLSHVMAIELGPHKITVNCVNPGYVETDMSSGWMHRAAAQQNKTYEEVKQASLEATYGRVPTKQLEIPMSDVINSILFFASGLTSQVTGCNIVIDGGYVIA